MNLFTALTIFSAFSFVIYGVRSLTTEHMKLEFNRYGLQKFRIVVGSLEIIGGSGLIGGLYFPPLYVVASGGLFLLMMLGTATRIYIKDPLPQTLPAFMFMLVNAYLLGVALEIF